VKSEATTAGSLGQGMKSQGGGSAGAGNMYGGQSAMVGNNNNSSSSGGGSKAGGGGGMYNNTGSSMLPNSGGAIGGLGGGMTLDGSGAGAGEDPLSMQHRLMLAGGGGLGWVGAYSPEQRRLRIEKFIEKRSRRVWTKKVKYDVRKNFADSRLRVKVRHNLCFLSFLMCVFVPSCSAVSNLIFCLNVLLILCCL
jgi:hypothetical protein